jgi:hypothetical protein
MGQAQMEADDVKRLVNKWNEVSGSGRLFIPNANMYLFYKVGSRNEYQGITGLSHFFLNT